MYGAVWIEEKWTLRSLCLSYMEHKKRRIKSNITICCYMDILSSIDGVFDNYTCWKSTMWVYQRNMYMSNTYLFRYVKYVYVSL